MREINNNIKTFSPLSALSLWFCHLGLVLFFYIVAVRGNLKPYYWGALFVGVASVPYIVAALRAKFILYEPKYLFLGALVLSHTARMFLEFDEIGLPIESWTYIMKLLVLGTIVFLAGYNFAFSKNIAKSLPLRNFVFPKRVMLKIPPKLYVIGWILRILPMIVVRLGPEPFYIMRAIIRLQGWQIMRIVMTSAIYAALMIDAYIVLSDYDPEFGYLRKRKHLSRLLFFFVAELLFAFTITGMKENLLIPILLVFIVYLNVKRKIPYMTFTLIMAFFIAFVMPFMNVYRLQHWSNRLISDSVKYAFEEFYVDGNVQEGQIYALKRLSAPLEISIISSDLRKEGIKVKTYSSILDYLSQFIPRFLWPDKPSIDYTEIGRELGILHEDDYETSICLTLIGSLITNFGVYGVIIGMFMVGFILRTYWEWLVVRTNNNLFSFIVYFLALYTWLRIDEFAICLHSNIAFFVYLYFMVKLLKGSK